MSWRTIAKSNKELINGIRDLKLIKSDIVYQAMKMVDRGDFCDREAEAYHDAPSPIGYGATISAPHMHAFAMEDLKDHIKPGSRILDVGSGSGYLCACFAAMLDRLEMGKDLSDDKKGKVLGIEIVPQLVEKSLNNMKKSQQGRDWLDSGRVQIEKGNGWESLENRGQFDAIHVGAAAAEVPKALMDALAPGGRCVIPVGGEYESQFYKIIDKSETGQVKAQDKMEVRYVPLVRKERH